MPKIELKGFQDRFIFSKKRYPGFWGSWAVGKSYCLILRALMYSQLIPNNLGIIFRKEYTDLRDSTVKDFERYTSLKVGSDRSVKLTNGSEILFRHIEELNNIQNINLGWFAIEQADELPTSNEFFLLFGRLRRSLQPTDKFLEYEMPERTGFVIGNAGDHWGRELWKDGKLDDSECIEANTLENMDVLPSDFIKSLETLKRQRPEIYAQFVLNDWNVTSDRFVLIKNADIEALRGLNIHYPLSKYLVSVDPSMGGDECPIYVFENTRIIDQLIIHDKDTMKVCGHVQTMMHKHGIDDVAVDVIGIGAGIADRLAEQGRNVIRINSAEKPGSSKFLNRRAEMWWYVSQQIQDKQVIYPEDELLRKQLSTIRYKVINSNGQIQMEHKPDAKKRLGSSPDRADAFVYGIWGLQYVTPRATKEDQRRRGRAIDYPFNPMTV